MNALLNWPQQVSCRASQPLSRCPSVCLSITPWHCIKMVTRRITKSSLLAASRSLVFSDKILCPWDLGEGVSLKRGRQRGYPLKRRYFATIGSYSVKSVVDRYRLAEYHNKQ